MFGDVDGDNDIDIVSGHGRTFDSNNQMGWYPNNAGTYNVYNQLLDYTYLTWYGPKHLLADYDGDGLLDIHVMQASNKFAWMNQSSPGNFAAIEILEDITGSSGDRDVASEGGRDVLYHVMQDGSFDYIYRMTID